MHQEAHVVGFKVGQETYGIPIAALHEIVRVPEITPIPAAPAHIEGVMNLRGKIVAVVDLRKRFGTCAGRIDRHSRILVVAHQGRMAGLIVDAASEVIRIPASEIETAPALMQEGGLDCVTGLGKFQGRLIILLDVDKVLKMRDQSNEPGAAGAATAESGNPFAQSARAGK